ncbi:MAG: N-acetylmuramoyl-L-alanine amidase [Oscillospiraceae bacterium]
MKKKALVALVSVMLLISAVVGVLVATNNFDKQFIIKDEEIMAAYLDVNEVFSLSDSEDVFKVKLDEAVTFFKENGINTVIIPFNDGANSISELKGYNNVYQNIKYLSKKDILRRIKSELTENKIQLMLSVNCTEFMETEVMATVEELNGQYALAGIVLTNYNLPAQNLQSLKMMVNKKHKNFLLALEKDTADDMVEIQQLGAVDLYIFNNIDEAEYSRLKQGLFRNEKLLFSYKTEKFLSGLFFLSNFSELDGVVITQYSNPQQDLKIYKNMLDVSSPLQKFNFSVDSQFKVAYPSKDMETYYSGIFVAGTANPNDKVYVNNEEVQVTQDGIFGKYIELSQGENIINVAQASSSEQFVVTLKKYTGTSTPVKNDSTVSAQRGQKIQTVGPLTSILSDYNDDSSIIDGLPADTQLEVVSSKLTRRGKYYTYAYELSNGAFILAKNVKWINEENYQKPTLHSAEILEQGNGDEILKISKSGNPAVVSYFDEEITRFTFLNTRFDAGFSIPQSVMVGETEVVEEGENVVVTIKNVPGNGIWGYNVQRNEDSVEIYIKKTPHQSKGEKPLTGVTIMLDAGHGDDDVGAVAVGGIKAPSEKDLNLAVAQATKICLEKLGATVLMTRDNDTFYTLDERRDAVNNQKPDLFIAMHHNSTEMYADAGAAFGTEVYYFTPQSKAVAEIMCDEISVLTQRKNRGEKFGYFYVTRTDIAPSILIEYGFVVNPAEYSKLYQDIDIYKAAFATAQGVLDVIPE